MENKPTPLRISSIESSKTEIENIVQKTSQEIQSSDGKPEFFIPLNDVELVEGGQATLQCGVQGKHPLKIQWFKQNSEIIPQFRYKASHDVITGNCKLLITTLLEDDVGQYSCKATNDLGEAVTSAKLFIIGKIDYKTKTNNCLY
jgi:titin